MFEQYHAYTCIDESYLEILSILPMFFLNMFSANGKNRTFAICHFYVKVSSFAFVVTCELLLIFFWMDLFNDSRNSKENQLQADVCCKMWNFYLPDLMSSFTVKPFDQPINLGSRLTILFLPCQEKERAWGRGYPFLWAQRLL